MGACDRASAIHRLPDRLHHRSIRASAILALALAAAFLARSGSVAYTGSDPRGTLLTAQAIIDRGTFALDAYPQFPSSYRTVVDEAGHRFYAYPPGAPLIALPAVAIAQLAGLDMSRVEDDDEVQRIVAAISVGIAALLAFLFALRWLPWPLTTLLTAVFVFGTPVMSTMSTAFWSTNATVVVTLAALVLLARYDASTAGVRRSVAIGLLLGFAFWCRPPAFLLAALVMTWALLRAVTIRQPERRPAIVNAVSLACAAIAGPALLMAMSLLTYGTWLPDYYIGSRLAASDRFGTALVAHLVSPSRGILIYAPAAVLAVVAALRWPRRILRAPLAGVALAWVFLHLLLVSRFAYWWGGYSYGSRLMVDALPGVFVLLCAAAALVRDSAGRWQVLAVSALVFTGAAGVWINSVQGLFNRSTMKWNVVPDIDRFPGYAFDWHLPQFLSTEARLGERLRRHERWFRKPLDPGVEYTARTAQADFQDWSGEGETPSARFLIAEDTLRGADRMMLTLSLGAEAPLAGEVWFNGQQVARITLSGRGSEYHVVGVPRRLVRTVEYDVLKSNVLEWHPAEQAEATRPVLLALRVQAGRRHTP
jgi:hypothetical protein